MLEHSQLVFVKRVKGKGRGVFARIAIKEGAMIERVPVVLVPLRKIVGGKDNPFLSHYAYVRSASTYAVALGYGSLYNHSYAPNARYDDGPEPSLFFTALRDVEAGEEITVNYNGIPDDQTPVWFDVVE